tara:strand:+ start:229 stop:429 length:201 start_codon:yes stop_codon:yes gene_type:complete
LTDINDIDTENWEELWRKTPDDEVYCGLCGDGYDTWKEVQVHMFEAHYDMVKDDAKEWFKNVKRLD